MPLGNDSLRVVIAGAASLRGADLKRCMEENAFPAGEIRLVDEEFAAGTLTELAGEPAVVQALDESSFDGARFAFFAGSPKFAAVHEASAIRAGATVIDLTGGISTVAKSRMWIPRLDALLHWRLAGFTGEATGEAAAHAFRIENQLLRQRFARSVVFLETHLHGF